MITIAEGTDDDQRVGRRIVVTQLHWRYTIRLQQTLDGNKASDIVRVMVLQDKQCNGAVPGIGGAQGILTADTFDSFAQLANKGRFTILMDKYHRVFSPAAVGDGTTNEYGQSASFFQWHKNVKIPIEYDTTVTTGAVASIRSNNIVVLTWSLDGNCSLVSEFRVRYTDH